MKNINIEEVKRYLKRSLKNKVKITTSLIVLFMMSNSIVSGHVIVVNEGKIGSGSAGAAGNKWGHIVHKPPKGAIALNISATDENRVAHENVGSYSVAVGYEAKAKAENSVAIGRESNIEDGAINSIAIGRKAKIFKSDQIESNSSDGEDVTERSIAIGRKAETKIYKSIAIGSEASAESALIYNPYVLEKYKAIYETFKNDITSKDEGYKFSKNDINSLKTKYLSKIEEQKRAIVKIENEIKAIDNNTEKKKTFLGRQELNDQKNELIRKKHDLNINTETLKQIFEKKFAYLNDKNLEKKQVLNQFNDEKIITQGGEGVSIGSKTKAVDQATSLGNGTYAIGRSSIAIGSDDNRYFTEKVTNEDKKHYFEGLYKAVDPDNTTYTPDNLRQYSPTLAAGEGGIAFGTRALSYGIGATSIGAFSYALGDYSTAMGAETRAEGYGAIAVGNKTKVFSDYAVAVGNENQVSQSGGLAYGFKAISSGRNTIAIGTDVYGNVKIDDNKGIHLQYKQINKNASKVEDKLKNNINEIKKVHDEYKKIDETLNNLENSYTIDSSYVAKDVDKKLKYNGVEENTGKKVKEQNGNNAIVIGTNAVAKGNNSITLGHASFSMKDNSAAIGSLTYVDGKNSIGLGIGTRVFSDNSLAVGIGSVIARDSQNSLVFGNAAYVGSINSIALGNKASVTLDNSLALGNNSTTDYNTSWLNEKGYVPKGAISLPSSTNVGVISVGSIGQERRITNVAAGYRDTDAVNVSQLKSVEDKLSAVNLSGYDSSMVNFVSVNKTDGEGKDMQDLAIKMARYKEYIQLKSKLLEMKVRKEKNNETINDEVEKEIEKLLEDEKYNDIKNKDENFKKFETQVTNKIKGNVEVKDILTEIDKKKDELIEDKNLKSILNDEEIKKFEKSNFYNKSTTGKNAIAIGVFADATKEQAVAIGKNAKGDSFSVAIGGDSESGNTAVAIGDRAKALGGRSVAIGHGAKANHNDSVAIGKDSEANSSTDKAYLTDDQNGDGRTFAVGGTVKRRITGVSDGSADSDAVTVAQLKRVGNITFTGDTGSNVKFELVKNIDIKGATAKKQNNIDIETWGQGDNKHTVENIQTHVSKNGDTQRILIGMKDVPRFTGIKLGGNSDVNLTVSNEGNLNLNNKKLTGLADGDISNSSTDAVTGKQLEARTKFTIQADEYRENKTKIQDKSFELSLPQKIIFRGASKTETINGDKQVPKTYDTTYATENVRTYIEKNGNDYEVIVAFKNKPKFDKVQIGEVGGFVISKNTEAFEFNSKKLGKVAPGRIGDKSGDVVVGAQLDEYVKELVGSDDVTVGTKENVDKGGKKYSLGLSGTIKNKINEIDTKASKLELKALEDKGITFIGDTRGANKDDIKVKLGEEIQIKAEDHWNFNKKDKKFDESQDNYETENLSTYYRIKDGKKQILIGMKDKPRFEEVTIGKSTENRISITKDGISITKKVQVEGNNNNPIDKSVKIKVDDNGSLKLDSKKLTGLADGTDSTDAVNKKQLDEKASATELNTLKRTVTTNTSSINTNKEEIAKKLNKDDLSIEGDTYISVGGTDKKYKLKFNKSELEKNIDLSKNTTIGTINENLNKKANSDATNITDTIWREKLNVYSKTETNNEIKKVKVVGTNDEIDVSPNDKTFTVSLSKTMKDKIDAKANTSDLEAYAKKDASNITESEWVTKLGDNSLENGNKLAKSSAVKKMKTELQNQIDSKADKSLMKFKYKTSTPDTGKTSTEQELDLTSTEKTLDFQAGSNLTTEVEKGYIKYALKSDLTDITSISGKDNKSKIELTDNALKLTHDGASVTIAKDVDKAKITGLKDFDINDKTTAYGQSGVAATQKEVKDVLNMVSANSTEQSKLKNGTLGTLVYTDKDGNRVVKANDGKYYKAEDVDNNGIVKVGKNDSSIDKKDLVLSTVNPDGSTTTPTTKLRIADGSLKEGSKEAVTGGQVYEIKNKVDTLTRDNYINFAGDSGNDIKISLAKKLSIVGEGDTTPAETAKNNITVQAEDNKLTVKLAKNLQNMKSFETEAKDGNKTTLNQDGLKIGNDTNAVTITNESITGLKDTSVDNTKYGQSGVAATQKEVKAVLNKVHSNEIEQKKIKDGLAGTVVYTDKDGNKLVKLNGKFYKQSELKDGELPVGSSYKDGIKEEDIFLSTVNPDGKTTKPITIGNVASALGLSKDSKNTSAILKKLVNKEAKKDVYNDAELNKVVTLRDLQFLAKQGITFAGSTGTANKYLGDTISINSKTSDYKDLNKGGFTTNYVTKNIAVKVDNTSGDIEIGLAKELKDIKSISGENDKSKIELTDSGLKLTNDNTTLSIEKDDNGFKLSGLKDSDINNGYGQSGVAATQKEVKEVLDKVNKNIKGQNDLKDGLAGTVIYTDKDGNKLVKVNGAYYKQSDVKDGNVKDNATSISSDNIKVTLVGADGSIDKGVTLGNLKSTLGLNKANNGMTEINKKRILSKLTGNENYSEKELDNAVSLRDLQFVAKTGLVFSGNSGSVIKPIGETVRIIGGAKLSEKILEDTSSVIDPKAKYSDNGKEDFEKNFTSLSIATRVNEEGNIQIGISKDIKDIRTIEFDKGENEKAIGKIKGLANGEISSTSNDAINGAQLNDILDKVGIKVNDDKTGFNTLEIKEIGGKKPSNILEGLNKTIESVNEQSVGYKANNGKVETVKLKEGFNFVNGTNITASVAKDGEIKYSLNKELKGIKGIELKNKDKKLSLAVNNKGEAVIRREESIQSTEKVITTDDKLKLKFKSSTASDKNEKVINIAKNEALDFKAGSNLTSKVSDGSIEYGLKSDLKGITSISSENDKSKIELTDSGLKLTNDNATLSIEKDGDNFKLSGLKDSDVNNGYGKSGVAATQKEVKNVLDKVNKNIKGQNDLKDGLAGTVIYTDKDGNKLVKLNGKFYKQSELKNGELPVGSSYKDGIKEKDIFLSTVNSDGSTTTPTTKLRIADGSISAGSKEAVTGGQVYELKNKIEDISKKQFIKIKGDTNDEQTLNLGDTLEVVGEGDTTPAETAKNNITVQADKNKLTVKLAKKLQNMKSFETEAKDGNKTTLNQDGLKIGNDTKAVKITNESITGLTERKVSGSDYGEKGRAATEGAVKEVYDKLNTLNQGLTFKANKGETKKEIGKILGVLGGATLKEKLIEDRSSIIDPKAKSSDNGKEDFDTNYNSKNVATRVGEDNNIHIGVSKELKDMRSFETEKDGEGNSSKLNQKELSIIGKDGSINISNKEIKFGENGGTISGLKGGKIEAGSTDAVSGGQVYEKLKTIDSHLNTNYYNKSKINEMIGEVDKKSTVALEKSELALGGVANAVAMANLVQVNSYSRHRHNLSAAYGYYGGSHALAVGFSGTNEERNFVYKLSGSVNNKGNLAFGVGAGVMLGEENENNYPEKVKKVSELENKVKKQEEEINKLKKQAEKTDMLEKQVAELMKLIKKKN